jgi:hypothetical protein
MVSNTFAGTGNKLKISGEGEWGIHRPTVIVTFSY